MKKLLPLLIFICTVNILSAQSLYFPPTTGTTWDTIAPASLGWCQPNIDTLYSFLQNKNTDAFILLKDGKIVLEKYFGTFTADSFHSWYSAGKSLTAMMLGITQQNNLVNIDSPATHYLGTGWTSEAPTQEDSITLLNLLTMASGTSPAPTGGCTNEDTAAACLQYLVPAGTQWAYHTGAYRKLQSVMSIASGRTYNALSQLYLGSTTGMTGAWVAQEFVSIPRSAARFGLLSLNHGIWNADTLLRDTAYFRAMTNTSQSYNLSYGYLWWLNGKASYMLPGGQTVFTGSLIPNAPADMFCALGKNDQKIYVVPSLNMVVVRMGNSADTVTNALSTFDNQLWGYIDSLTCNTDTTTTGVNRVLNSDMRITPNPASNVLYLWADNSMLLKKIYLYNLLGQVVNVYNYSNQIDISQLPQQVYLLRACDQYGNLTPAIKLVKQ